MNRRAGILIGVVAASLLLPSSSISREVPARTGPPVRFANKPQRTTLPPDLHDLVSRSIPASAVADTFLLASFGWENGMGGPDAQGWVSVDRTAELDTFFHVAGTAELDGGNSGGLVPLEGNQSLWCGVDESTESPYCRYPTLPGYGNDWYQKFESAQFDVTGDVTLSYKVRWDSEAGEDRTFVQYRNTNGDWISLEIGRYVGATFYDGTGETVESLVIPGDQIGGALLLRFLFRSDGAWSDEDGLWPTDGAILLDSLQITDDNGIVDFQDFESETPGAFSTSDGEWMATTRPGFGNFGDIYLAATVVQEDPCFINLSGVWGFFDDPLITNYGCGGASFPLQGAVRYGPNADGYYLTNEIWSPMIDNVGAGDEYILSLRTYQDLPLDNLVFYTWGVRNVSNGCPQWWDVDYFVYFGDGKNWVREDFQVGATVDADATQLQLLLRVMDLCGAWCGLFGSGACHSHAPLFDRVELRRVDAAGPRFNVNHASLFQDNFAGDGTLTGTVRADAAVDILPSANPSILPGDSIAATVGNVGTDPYTGEGPSAYVYVALWPAGQVGKTGGDLEAPETRPGLSAAGGKRYPLVDQISHDGVTWHCFRMDTAFASYGGIVSDRYCFDLNDAVLTPGDTICYVLCAEDSLGQETYFSRRLDGQGDDFVTSSRGQALDSPMELTCLPAAGYWRGGNTLYIDDADDRGGPAQLYFDTAFQAIGIWEQVDRYDVLGPSSNVGNSLASRVTNVATQIIGPYRNLIWCSSSLDDGLIGDGSGDPEKSDDYGLLLTFLDQHPNNPGLYLSGDDIAEEWVGLSGSGATGLRSTYMNFNLVSGSHVDVGEPVSPLLVATGPDFVHLGNPDEFYAFGGCPIISDFDVLEPTGAAETAFPYPNGSGSAVVSQATSNSAVTTARVVLSGFGYDFIRNDVPEWMDRFEHIWDILLFFQNSLPYPSGVDTGPTYASYLDTAYPNPFNPTTTIRYGVAERGHVSLRVYNVAGQLVRTLVNEERIPREGGYDVVWDGRSDAGQTVSSGVYFYKLETSGFVKTRKMVLLK